MGNIAVFIVFMSVGVYFPYFLWFFPSVINRKS
jgi:hypothetical protein